MMKKTILIIDGPGLASELLEQIFSNEYDVVLVDNGKRAIDEIHKRMNELVLVFVDWDTPLVQGKQILQSLKNKEITEHIPVILTTDKEDTQIDIIGYSLDAAAVIHKPYAAVTVRKQCVNLMNVYERIGGLQAEVQDKNERLEKQKDRLNAFYDNLLYAVSVIVEYKIPETDRHVKRMKGFARLLGTSYMGMFPSSGLTDERISEIMRAAAVHDIGKIAIPDQILQKPTKLTDDEREVMMSHTTKGVEVLGLMRDVQDEEQYRISCEVCRWHHEKYDGQGYPDGLKGDEIPLSAQIVSLIDIYDALVSDRVYKKAYSLDTAFQMIMSGECGAFSPELLQCFESTRKLMELFAENN